MRKTTLKSAVENSSMAVYVNALLSLRARRLREAVNDRDAGASAIELAIITAILVGLAVVVLLVVKNVVTTRSNQIQSNNNGIP